jgi:hypothetical protein
MQECDGLSETQTWGVPLDGPIVACPDRPGFPDDCELFCIDIDTDISLKKCDGVDGYRTTQMWKWEQFRDQRVGFFKSDADPSKCIDFSWDAPHLANCEMVIPVNWDSLSLSLGFGRRCLAVVDGGTETPKLGMQECDGLNATQAWDALLDGPIVASLARPGFADDRDLFCIDALEFDGALTDISLKKCAGGDRYPATQMWTWVDFMGGASRELTSPDIQTFV